MDIGLERLILKNGRMTCYFISNKNSAYYQSEAFTRVLKFMQANPRAAKMKEANNKLTLSFENVKSVKAAIGILEPISK
jgi:transcription-repair coupling factor (superfamily II helicase)